jgi:hypothetical protein
MTKRRVSLLIAGLFLLIAASALAGGWSVITVNEFPEYGVVGKTATVTFSVRAHGATLIEGLKPVAFIKTPDKRNLKINATPGKRPGDYRFDLSFTQPGDWTVSIDSGFLFQMINETPDDSQKSPQAGYVTIPLKVIPADATSHLTTEKQRGERLFNLKGCAACHGTGIGPALTGKKLAADFVMRALADPVNTFKYKELEYGQMPNLDLKIGEIAALTEFLTNR